MQNSLNEDGDGEAKPDKYHQRGLSRTQQNWTVGEKVVSRLTAQIFKPWSQKNFRNPCYGGKPQKTVVPYMHHILSVQKHTTQQIHVVHSYVVVCSGMLYKQLLMDDYQVTTAGEISSSMALMVLYMTLDQAHSPPKVYLCLQPPCWVL